MKLANVKVLSVFAHVGLKILLAHVKQQQQQEQEKGSRKTTTATVWKQSQFLFVLQFAHSGFLFARMLATKWLKHTTTKQGRVGK